MAGREPRKTLQDLMELTSRLSQDRQLEDALQQIVDTALRLLPADHTSVRLLEAEDELVSFTRAGHGRNRKPLRFRRGEGVVGWVSQHGKPARIDDVAEDPRFRPLPHQGFPVRSLLAVPMWLGGEVVGVLTAASAQRAAFSAEDETQARLLANCAVPLIDKARLQRFSVLPQLEHAMGSPLRLRLIAELLRVGCDGLPLDQALLEGAQSIEEVRACLRPLVRWQIIEELDDPRGFRLRNDISEEVLEALYALVRRSADQLLQERRVRHQLLGGMIGVDPKMQLVFEVVRQVARIEVPVLITGETGTGKELVARAIHDSSPRRGGFFGAVNCATLTEGLFESQVFGHARGAFTGAVQDYVGLAERCDGGTLFLDEVGELSLPNQVKLLRLLQGSAFTRLGESETRRSDFRLISATNRHLEAMVEAGKFREDLYYRLAVFPLRVPSLRERLGDIEYLVEGILAAHAQRYGLGGATPRITRAAIEQLKKHRWPGNVRELENVIARAVIMAGNQPISPEHLPEVQLLSEHPQDGDFGLEPVVDVASRSLREVERDHIVTVLRRHEGNIKATAEVLGVSRTTLYKKIRDYDIELTS